MSRSSLPERWPELAVSTIGFRAGTLAASAAALRPSARVAARRPEARMGRMSVPFLEGRRLRRASGDPAANRVDGGGGKWTADERHRHALARRERPLELQEKVAVIGIAGGDAQQARGARGLVRGGHAHQVRVGGAVAQIEAGGRGPGSVARGRGAGAVEDLLLDVLGKGRRGAATLMRGPTHEGVALSSGRALRLQEGTADSLPACLDLDVYGLGAGVRCQVGLESRHGPDEPLEPWTGGDAHALDFFTGTRPFGGGLDAE